MFDRSQHEGAIRIPSGESAAYGAVGRPGWLEVDWREHQRWVSVEGRPVNTVVLGSGTPIAFIHGLSGRWPNWLEQLAALSARHRVIAMDLPGFGHSPMPAQPISMALYAELVAGVLDELGVERSVLVGNSMGGLIASELAIAQPQRVERLVLVSSAGISTQREPTAAMRFTALSGLDRGLAAGAGLIAARADAVARHRKLRNTGLALVVRHPSRLEPAIASELIRGAGKPGLLGALESMLADDLRSRLDQILCPTLIVWGERDRMLPVRDSEVFASLIPDARLVIFEDTGHMAMLERPAAFNALLEDFLAA